MTAPDKGTRRVRVVAALLALVLAAALVHSFASIPGGSVVRGAQLSPAAASRPAELGLGDARVFIVAVWVGSARMVPWHEASFARFVGGARARYVFVNNARDIFTRAELRDAAARLPGDTVYVEYDQSCGEKCPGISEHHAYALHAGIDAVLPLLGPCDAVWLIDTDMFLLSPFKFSCRREPSIVTRLQRNSNLVYVWPNNAILDLPGSFFADLSLLLCGSDSGSCTHDYLVRHAGNLTVREIDEPVMDATPFGPSNGATLTLDDLARIGCWQAGELPPHVCEFLARQAVRIKSRPMPCVRTNLYVMERGAVVYHIGSAGSNWRNCDELFVASQQEAVIEVLRVGGARVHA